MYFNVCQLQHLFDFLLGLCIIDNISKTGLETFPRLARNPQPTSAQETVVCVLPARCVPTSVCLR